MKVANRQIGAGHPPYVVAELSANHNGSLDRALRIVDAAADAGADAVKLQTYRAETMTLESDMPGHRIAGGLWSGQRLYDLYNAAHMPWEWHTTLFSHAACRGVVMFSTPFDRTAVDLLESLGSPAYKIASFEAVDLPLIRHVASTRKPMIISTGMADLEEIVEAVAAARDGGCEELALLHCVSGYPAPPEDYKLANIKDMAERFGVPVGLSDHTRTNTIAVASVALGAAIIEKHLTLDRHGGGPDDSFSIEPGEFAELCRDVRTVWSALGRVDYSRKSSEQGNVQFRRSLYFVRDMAEGEVITADAVRSVRPGYGLAPKHLESIIGRTMRSACSRNTPVSWDKITEDNVQRERSSE